MLKICTGRLTLLLIAALLVASNAGAAHIDEIHKRFGGTNMELTPGATEFDAVFQIGLTAAEPNVFEWTLPGLTAADLGTLFVFDETTAPTYGLDWPALVDYFGTTYFYNRGGSLEETQVVTGVFFRVRNDFPGFGFVGGTSGVELNNHDLSSPPILTSIDLRINLWGGVPKFVGYTIRIFAIVPEPSSAVLILGFVFCGFARHRYGHG